ncbi:lipocalin family protein [Segatella copri]|jgi:hypothetical protein|uniref:Lipocalin family protein n=1 Tax=Segatella copri TaxID=165179 RepID=A0AAW5I8A5_9BACT|nr:lipocalin family protein [Segatella copri]MCF0068602.1 lipocalin family protein [Segatella copri]MCP9459529.1 lipocalin family protein [Segatella copri]MCP9502514.1 lipocalin family protein [Segatella copri]MCP9505635.1 lipocalin family protein [Segatella copri]MCP9508635.1 lipocalin family protein [Segatella copri]
MKKLHFSLLAILFALFAMVSFTACSSDDEDTPSTEDVQTYIIGMWQPTHVTGYDWDENDKPAKVDQDIDIDIDDVDSFEFKQNGIFNEYAWTGNKWEIDCSGEHYNISGNKLTTYDVDGTTVLDVYTIQSINLTTMVLKYNLDGNASYPSTITFKKIK